MINQFKKNIWILTLPDIESDWIMSRREPRRDGETGHWGMRRNAIFISLKISPTTQFATFLLSGRPVATYEDEYKVGAGEVFFFKKNNNLYVKFWIDIFYGTCSKYSTAPGSSIKTFVV